MRTVTTHNGIFHADEVTAIALLEVFVEQTSVKRVPHQTKKFDTDFVIDIGKKFDGVSRFDHHQYKGGKSSAGLIWDSIEQSHNYREISTLVEMVDNHDTGVKKAAAFEFPSLISAYNHKNIYGAEQDEAFEKAVAFATVIIKSLKDAQDEISTAERICEEATLHSDTVFGGDTIAELHEFNMLWSSFFNGEKAPEVGAVMWFDPQQNLWKAQVTPKKKGSFEFNGRKFLPDDSMEFVHAAGFFAVAKTRGQLVDFLINNREA